MEDILASIRRIIASDQTVGHGRSFLTPQKATALPGAGSASPEAPPAVPEFAPEPEVEPAAAPSSAAPEFPSLQDLDTFVMPPAPMPDRDDDRLDDDQAARAEPRPTLPPGLRSANDRHALADHVFDLRPEDRVIVDLEAEPLISSATDAYVSSSFNALAESVMLRDPEMIERLATEAIRPLLKTWLDENLPNMVERLVRAEIERVARGGRSRG